MRTSILLLSIALLAAPATAAAGVYRWVGADGAVTYSDRPQPVSADPPAAAAPAASATAPAPASPATAGPPASGTRPAAPVGAIMPAPARPQPPAVREPAATTTSTSADEVLELSGVKPQLALVPMKMAGEFRPRQGQLTPQDAAALEQILARNFDPDRLYTALRADFRRRGDARKLNEVGEWLRSPLGRKITALEVAAGLEADAGQRMVTFAPGGKNGPPPARVAMMERIDWIAGVTDSALDSILVVARAMAGAVNTALPPDQRQPTAQIERQIQHVRGQARAKVAQGTLMFMLYQYRSLEDDELQQYADFLATDAGRWYSATMSKATIRMLSAVAHRTATDVIRAIPAQRWRGAAASVPPAR
jgi:predicted flap endonuclease-1-like 5' DNA nuclease